MATIVREGEREKNIVYRKKKQTRERAMVTAAEATGSEENAGQLGNSMASIYKRPHMEFTTRT